MGDGLLDQVKRKLRITWDDPDTDERLEGDIIPSAEADIRFKVGIPDSVEFDFAEPGIEHRLLLAHCYYQWTDADDDEFADNYSGDIAVARQKWEVTAFAEAKKQAPDLP